MLRQNQVDPFVSRINPPLFKESAGKALDQLRFGVKSIIFIKGHPPKFGNTLWDEMNKNNLSEKHAPCVKTLLKAGAILMGILHTSEFAFDINGVSAYGMPINPRVNNGIPGGSSSGSAAAVAGKEIDFALGTDTGGSIRIPAAYCGVWSLRPTTGAISTARILAVGSRYDTVGIIASHANVLHKVGTVLLPEHRHADIKLRKMYVIKEALDLCPEHIKVVLNNKIEQLQEIFCVCIISMDDITQETDPTYKGLSGWKDATMLMLSNTWETLSPWLAANIPNWEDKDSKLTEEVRANFYAGKMIDELFKLNPLLKAQAEMRVENNKSRLNAFLSQNAALLIPTIPFPAPEIGTKLSHTDFMNLITLTSIASLADLPQVQMPIAEDECHKPLGLSLIGAQSNDHVLINAAVKIESHLKCERWMAKKI